jgi:hypothetical protein
LCKEFEKESCQEEQYNILLSSFSSFQNKLRALTIDAKQRQIAKMKQSTFCMMLLQKINTIKKK